MNPRKIIAVFFLFCCASTSLFAQTEADTIRLHPVFIQGDRLNAPDRTTSSSVLDTSFIAKATAVTLADQLEKEGALFVKSGGPGSLTTVSIHGTTASHLGLTWNGLSINNPSLGLYDLSLLPTFLTDQITLQYTGNGATLGSGAIGGAVHLSSAAPADSGFSVRALTGTGSYGYFQEGLQVAAANGKVATNSRLYTQHAVNNYKYITPEGATASQPHAAYHQLGFSQDLSLTGHRSLLSLHGWYLQNDHQLPPIMVVPVSKQEQKDESLRLSAEWNRRFAPFELLLRSGYVQDHIRFTDGIAAVDAKSSAASWQSVAEVSRITQKFHFTTHLEWNHSSAKTDGYRDVKFLDQFSAAAVAGYHVSALSVDASLRETIHNGSVLPLLPSAQCYWQFSKPIAIRISGAAIYRIPTLNDRYWQPGGNLNLQPEKGQEYLATLIAAKQLAAFHFSLDAGIFYSNINNLIVWVPGDNGLYAAANVHQIESKGIESTFNIRYEHKKIRWSISCSPQYNESVILKSSAQFANAIGKQMMYTPRWLLKGMLSMQYSVWSLRYYFHQTGERFATPDHSTELPAYSLSDFVLAYDYKCRHHSLTVTLSVNNAFNENYQVLIWRAMPQRTVQAGLLLGIFR